MDPRPAKILIIDDIQDNLELLGELLTLDGFHVEIAMGGEMALKRVQEFRPDLILLDTLMPGMDGYEVCARLKAEENTKNIPVVFVSSKTDVDSKVKGFRVGGVDFINKPFQHAEILVRVNTQITMQRLRQHLEEQNAKLEHLANTDYLTNLYNRRRFFHAAEEEFVGAVSDRKPISVTLIDLDYFKQVNDTFGHLVGDQVLIHIANLIRTHCRVSDVAARYGGEEFIILHPAIDKHKAYLVAERIRKVVETKPFWHKGHEIGVTLSAGVVDTLVDQDFSRIDDLLGLADKALYRAKDAGRNQVVLIDG